MDIEVLKSYLVDLGFAVNQPQLKKFDAALKDAAGMVELHTSGVIKDVAKWQGAITGAFVGISAATIGLADHVAMADQSYRLFGLRMFMTTEQARKMQIGLSALGASMDDLARDPELRSRFIELAQLQDRLAQRIGPAFEKNMQGIRDLRTEVSKLHIEMQYLSMALVSALYEKLAPYIDQIKAKFESWIDYVVDHLPQLADWFAQNLVPVLKDTWEILEETGDALVEMGVAFTNLIALLSGDSSIAGSTADFEKFEKAVHKVVGWMKELLDAIIGVEQTFAHLLSGLALAATGKWSDAAKELKASLEAAGATKPSIDLAHPFTKPEDKDDPAPRPGAKVAELFGSIRSKFDAERMPSATAPPVGSGTIAQKIDQRASQVGLDPHIAEAVARQESGMRQFDPKGNVVANTGSTARGIFQLLQGTAKGLGVDRNDTDQNIDGGVRMLADLMRKYSGSQDKAIAAYYWGAGNLDKAITRHQQLPPEVLNYVRGVESKEGMNVTVGDIAVHIMQPNASPEQVQRATTQGVLDAMRKQTQRNQAQLAFAG
jgi:hypothetical protein